MPDVGSGFKDNIAQVGVYFRSLNTKLIKEEPKYGVIYFVNISALSSKVVVVISQEISYESHRLIRYIGFSF